MYFLDILCSKKIKLILKLILIKKINLNVAVFLAVESFFSKNLLDFKVFISDLKKEFVKSYFFKLLLKIFKLNRTVTVNYDELSNELTSL